MKIRSLAAEAKIIRSEESRLPGPSKERRALRDHRIGIVRDEQRASLLAYAYLRGRPYRSAESGCRKPFPHSKVAEIAHRFGPVGTPKQAAATAVQEWRDSRVDLCGRGHGVMTRGQVGSTPTARAMPG